MFIECSYLEHISTLEIFYVIMRGVTLFSVHYEPVVVQISLWWAAIVSLSDGKH